LSEQRLLLFDELHLNLVYLIRVLLSLRGLISFASMPLVARLKLIFKLKLAQRAHLALRRLGASTRTCLLSSLIDVCHNLLLIHIHGSYDGFDFLSKSTFVVDPCLERGRLLSGLSSPVGCFVHLFLERGALRASTTL